MVKAGIWKLRGMRKGVEIGRSPYVMGRKTWYILF
jgi:hypothetical protein